MGTTAPDFLGVIPPASTPFDADLSIDSSAIATNTQSGSAGGAGGNSWKRGGYGSTAPVANGGGGGQGEDVGGSPVGRDGADGYCLVEYLS